MNKTPLAHLLILISFLVNTLGPVPIVQAQEDLLLLASRPGVLLPEPGVMVRLSPKFDPPILKGIKIHPDNPFRFDFILDKGNDSLPLVGRAREGDLKQETTKLIKYFLASLTIPEKDLWVNLSPYEKNRIIPESFGLTAMGRDLLAEDYILKQITASLIYPEDEIGKKFWKKIYEEAQNKFGTTNIPVNTFNKVWIIPDKAVVYENAKAGTAYVVEAKLRVMLEQDYLSLVKHQRQPGDMLPKATCPQASCQTSEPLNVKAPQVNSGSTSENINALGSQIVREIVIPELTKEVNEGKNFAPLRQVYNSLILATWYKKKIKNNILAQVYEDKNKVAGVNIDDPKEKERIYQRYIKAFKKGVFNYIKEDVYPTTQNIIPRKYFAGGEDCTELDLALIVTKKVSFTQLSGDFALVSGQMDQVHYKTVPQNDLAMQGGSKRQIDMETQKLITSWNDADDEKRWSMVPLQFLKGRMDPNLHSTSYQEFLMYALFDNDFEKRRRVAEINSFDEIRIRDKLKALDPIIMPADFLLEHLANPGISLDYGIPQFSDKRITWSDENTRKRAFRNKRMALLIMLIQIHRYPIWYIEHDQKDRPNRVRPQAIERRKAAKQIIQEKLEQYIQDLLNHMDEKFPRLMSAAVNDPELSLLGDEQSVSLGEVLSAEIVRYRWKTKFLKKEDSYKTVHETIIDMFIYYSDLEGNKVKGLKNLVNELNKRVDAFASKAMITQKIRISVSGQEDHAMSKKDDKKDKEKGITRRKFLQLTTLGLLFTPMDLPDLLDLSDPMAEGLKTFLDARSKGLAMTDLDNIPDYVIRFDSPVKIYYPYDSLFDFDIYERGPTNTKAGPDQEDLREVAQEQRNLNQGLSWKNREEELKQQEEAWQDLLDRHRWADDGGTENDSAQLVKTRTNTGGIDLTPVNNVLQAQKGGIEIKFHLNPAQLAQLQNAPGFTIGSITIQPLKNLPKFLGMEQTS